MACVDLAHGFGTAALGIFDGLCFVKNEQVVAVQHQLVSVAPKQRVGGEDDVVVLDFVKQGFAVRAVQRQDTQAGRITGSFAFPVENQ